MKATDINLKAMLEYHPEAGKVMFGRERMLIFRQQAMSVLRGLMYEQLGAELSRALLSQFGYQCGTGDYAALIGAYTWDTDIDKLIAGPVIHTWEGIVHATATEFNYDREAGRFFLAGEWTNSYEAEIHVQQFGVSAEPVCHSLTGYASGWGTSFMGRPIVAIETTCVGKGDDMCRCEIRDEASWGPEADPWREALRSTESSLVRDLEAKLQIIRDQQSALRELSSRQQAAISELSTPIMEVWDDVLVLPIVGVIDSSRSVDIMTRLLAAIAEGQARCVIIDVTGVDVVDTQIANYLIKVVQAAGLLGAHCVVTGVSPGVAQTLVSIGADLSSLSTHRDLKQGLRACIRFLGAAS